MSLVCDGSTIALEIASPSVTARQCWFSAWVKPADLTSLHTVCGLFNSGSTRNMMRLLLAGSINDKPRLQVQDGSVGQENTDATSDYVANVWSHVCGYYDNTSASPDAVIDLNGGSEGTGDTTKVATGIDTFAIGRSSDSSPSDYFNGKIADVAVGTGTLSAANIAALAAGQNPMNVMGAACKHFLRLHGKAVDWASAASVTNVGSPTYDKLDHPQTDWPDEADAITPIGRWSSVPYQILRNGESLTIGIPAFSADGVQDVTFTVTPDAGSYSGTSPHSVTSPSLNADSGVYEYCKTINASDFSATCTVTITAVITGNNGGTRSGSTDLTSQSLTNKHGLYDFKLRIDPGVTPNDPPVVQAYLDPTSGNDGTGAVNDAAHPFQTFKAAIDAIEAENQSNGHGYVVDSGEILCVADSYSWDGGSVSVDARWTNTETWFTVKPAPGVAKADVVFDADKGAGNYYPQFHLLKFDGVTFQGDGGIVWSLDRSHATSPFTQYVWMHDCDIIGYDHNDAIDPDYLGYVTGFFATDCNVSNCDNAWQNSNWNHDIWLVRGGFVENLTNNAFGNIPCVINVTVENLDPLDTGVHADVIQFQQPSNPWENTLYYGIKASKIGYNSITCAASSNSATCYGWALVNCLFLAIPGGQQGQEGGIARSWNHVLWLNNTFYANADTNGTETYDNGCKVRDQQTGNDTVITNGWIIGNTMFRLYFAEGLGSGGAGLIDVEDMAWRHNHIQDITDEEVAGDTLLQAWGYDCTTGDPKVNASGVPLGGSNLINRFDRLVNIDVAGTTRPATAGASDVGAWERVADAVVGGPLAGRNRMVGGSRVGTELVT